MCTSSKRSVAYSTIPGYRTDHSGVTLKLTLNENEHGRGTGNLTDTISDFIQTYAAHNNDDNLDNQQSEYSISNQLFYKPFYL